MPVADLMIDGLKLMVLGMGIVFVFLSLLIVLMTLMSRIARAIGDGVEEGSAVPAVPLPGAPTTSLQEDVAIPAVIAAAVYRYRTARQRLGR